MLDGDEAGREGAIGMAEAVGARMSVSVIALDDGCQPDQLTRGDIQRLLVSNDVGDSTLC